MVAWIEGADRGSARRPRSPWRHDAGWVAAWTLRAVSLASMSSISFMASLLTQLAVALECDGLLVAGGDALLERLGGSRLDEDSMLTSWTSAIPASARVE